MNKPLQTLGLYDAYRLPGYTIRKTARGLFGDPHAMVLILTQRVKKQCVEPVAQCITAFTTARSVSFETFHVAAEESTWRWTCAEYGALPA
jgi:hypothetical protein